MDWIEEIFHVSPDEGNGALELLFALAQVSLLDANFANFSGLSAREAA